jgi:hypothetical protein
VLRLFPGSSAAFPVSTQISARTNFQSGECHSMNRRAAWRSIRFKTAVPAAFEAGVRGMGIIRDISRTGLWMFGAAAQVSEGERATVTVRQPDAPPIVLRGKVRRALRYGFSVEFAGGERHHAGRDRRGRAATRAAGRAGGVPRVAGHAEEQVLRERGRAELGHVRLPDRDGAGGAEPRHQRPS